jgi:hypothetical protein
MKRSLLISLVACFVLFECTIPFAQQRTAYRIAPVSALPTTCLQANGEMRWLTSGSTGPYGCVANDTYELVGATGSGASRAFQAGAGTAAAPTFTFSADTDVGMFRQAANVLGFTTGGTERWRIDASGNLTSQGSSGFILGASGATATRILSATASLDFAAIAANTCSDLTIALANSALGDTIALGVPNASVVDHVSFTAWVSVAGTVTVRACNSAVAASTNPAAGTFRVTAIQF